MSKILKLTLVFLIAVSTSVLVAQNDSQEQEQIRINWFNGPVKAEIGEIAEISVPEKYHFADGDDTRTIMEYFGNQATNRELGYIAPETDDWFMVFEFDESGYVNDEEKDSLDADKILENFKRGNKEANKWREKNGIEPLEVIGWHKEPAYDSATNNLEWATIYKSGEKRGINYNIRYLGRKGVMEVIIVAGEENLDQVIDISKNILKSYSFTSGNKYSEFVKGDKMAEYGLAALVGGGAFAVAAKSGLLQKFWKLIVVAFAGIGAFFKKLFKRNKNDFTRSYPGNDSNSDNE